MLLGEASFRVKNNGINSCLFLYIKPISLGFVPYLIPQADVQFSNIFFPVQNDFLGTDCGIESREEVEDMESHIFFTCSYFVPQ